VPVVPAPAAVPRRRPALPPEHRRPRGGARVPLGPAVLQAMAGVGLPSAAPGKNHAPVVRGKNRAPVVMARPETALGVVLGHHPATARAGRRRPTEPGGPLPTEHAGLPARLRPMAFAGPLGHPRGKEHARQRDDRSATGPAEPARVPAASVAMRPAVRRRARQGRALASSDGQGRGRAPARAAVSGGLPPVPDAGPGTGTGTRLRRVRRADGAPTGPLNAPEPANPAPRGPTRTDPAPPGPLQTGPGPRGRERTGPAPRGQVRITRRGAAPGFRRPTAAARRTGPGKTGPGRAPHARARRGRAGRASRTPSSLPSSIPRRAPS
jgi:hypothetical protein